VTDHQALVAALRDADWAELLPRLTAYATYRLWRVGWAEGRDAAPATAQVQDVVNEAIDRCLTGDRKWNPAVNLETFLRGVVKSVISTAKKSDGRRKEQPLGADIDDVPAPPPDDCKGEEGRSAILDAAAACAQDDPDLSDLYVIVASEDGPTKREDLAEARGRSTDRVTAARVKLQRRLLSRYSELCQDAKQRRPR
jgi:DNA-directed RNA polymerase specialized sigma24 family protein